MPLLQRAPPVTLSGYQLAPSLGAAPREHFAAVLGRHALQEAVHALAPAVVRLVRPLHENETFFGGCLA